MKSLTLHIEGMSCGHCLNAVNQALNGIAGVRIHAVRLGRADLEYDEAQVAPTQIVSVVEAEGYRATPQETAGPA